MPRKKSKGDKLQTLEKQLEGKEIKKALLAVEKLGATKSQESMELLERLLYSERWHLRNKAACVLAQMGEEGIRILRKALNEGVWFTRASAILGLGKANMLEAVEWILQFRNDRNSVVQEAVKEALRGIITGDMERFVRGFLVKRSPLERDRILAELQEVLPDLFVDGEFVYFHYEEE